MDKNERTSLCKASQQNPRLYGSISPPATSGCPEERACVQAELPVANKCLCVRCKRVGGGKSGCHDAENKLVCISSSAGSGGESNNIQSSSDSLIGRPGNGQSPSLVEKAAKRVPCLGIIFALCASIFLGSAGMLVKMTHSVHGVQVAVFRASIQAAIYAAIIIFRKLPWRPQKGELKGVLGRALFGGSSITFSYNALKLIPFSDATTIRFSMPIWTLLIGYVVLGEQFGLVHFLAVVACISGVVLIAKPEFVFHLLGLLWSWLFTPTIDQQQPFNSDYLVGGYLEKQTSYNEEASLLAVDEQFALINETTTPVGAVNLTGVSGGKEGNKFQQLEGTLLALASSICLAISLVCLRLCKETKVEITILWLSLASVLIGSGLLVSINEWRFPDNWPDVLFILLNGLFGSIGQWFITNALKIEQSGVISLARTADIQVAFLYGSLLLHEPIKLSSILGSLLVTLGVVAVALPRLLAGESRPPAAGNEQSLGGCCCSFWRNWTSSSEQGRGPAAADIEGPLPDHLGDIPSISAAKKGPGKQLAVFVA